MARERTATPDAPPAADTAKPAKRRGVGTQTTATAPLGRPVAEPMVEQLAEGDSVGEIERPTEDYLSDREWLFGQVQHALNCPMIDAPFESDDDDAPGRGQRMEVHDADQPRTDQNPLPHRYRLIACLDCGRRARIDLGVIGINA